MGRDSDDTSTNLSRGDGDETSYTWQQVTQAAIRFDLAWKDATDPPPLGDFLPEEPADLRHLTLVELTKIDLDYRWSLGLRKTLADYQAEFPELVGNLPATLINDEYQARRRAGESVSWEEYRQTYPDQARELTRLFPGRGIDTVSMQPWKEERMVPGSEVLPGQVFDDFEVLELLGRGAFASVFLAQQISMPRKVALKITSPRGQEHKFLGQFDHPNVVRIYDHRELQDQGWRLLYMQYVPGGTLRHVVEKLRELRQRQEEWTGRLLFEVIDANLISRGEAISNATPLRQRWDTATWPEVVCWLGARIARGLSHAHGLKVLHCDLKPANVLLAADGQPKLADFNVSFHSVKDSEESAVILGGSLAYMSPEQLEAYNPDHSRTVSTLDDRSDLYSLGITLYELLLGTRPFPTEKVTGNFSEMLDRMAAVRRKGLSAGAFDQVETGWPSGLSEILKRLLAPDPAQRYASGQELARRLEICQQPQIQQILFPRPHDWRLRLRNWARTVLLTLALIPNLLAAWFHFRLQMHRVAAVPPSAVWSWAITAFGWGVLLCGLLLCLWRAGPVIRAVQAPPSDDDLSESTLRLLRSRCLKLGAEAATISLCAWMLLSGATGLALWLASPASRVGHVSHFAASILLGGLIAVAYPYCGVAWFSVCALYSGLAQSERFTDADSQEIRRLRQNSWLFLLLAAVMPLAAVALSILMDHDSSQREQRIDLIGLSIAGIVGFFLSMISFRAMQLDLYTFHSMAKLRDDSRD